MIRNILPIFLLIITLNGWASSRFSVYINEQKSGVIEVSRELNKNLVITKTIESITLRRGGSTIKTKNIYKTIEFKNGIPKEIEFKNLMGNTSIIPEYKVLFHNDKANLITPFAKKTINVDLAKVKQDYGEEIFLKEMVLKKQKEGEYLKFDQNLLNFDRIKVHFKGKTKTGYKFELISTTMNVIEDRVVNKRGETLISTMKFAGIIFKVVNQKLEKDTSENIEGAEILTPSLIKINYFIPRGYSVSKIVYRLTNSKPYDFTIIKTPFQDVKVIDKFSCILTVNRSKIPENAKPDRDGFYLKSSSIINLKNRKLAEITDELKRKSKDTYSFVENTLSFVYNYITAKNFDNVMANTDEILEQKKGDCTEHSFLATAIFRKAGIPARCVVGLVMGDNVFGYHMWVEIKLNGKWYPVDPTLNQLNPDPTHIRIDEFLPNPSSMKNIYKIILPLIQSISINPLKVVFNNGKTIEHPESFFPKLFNAYKWEFNNIYHIFSLSKKEGIFNERIYLISLNEKNSKIVQAYISILGDWKKLYFQDIKGKYVLFFENNNKIGYSFVHNSVLIIFVARSTRPVKIEKFRNFVFNKCIEGIDICQKEF